MVDNVASTPNGGLVAADTNAIHDFLADQTGWLFHAMQEAIARDQLLLPPVVLTEALSDPTLPAAKAARIRALPVLAVLDGYWERAGLLRAFLLSYGYRGHLGDVLIAQSCLDHDIPLITYDQDFRRFERTGLKLI